MKFLVFDAEGSVIEELDVLGKRLLDNSGRVQYADKLKDKNHNKLVLFERLSKFIRYFSFDWRNKEAYSKPLGRYVPIL